MACSLLGELQELKKLVVAWWWVQILWHSADKFSFRNGSIGNFFFAGARIYFQSLDAAIFLYSRVSHIPTHSSVLPAICTNDRLTLGCELQSYPESSTPGKKPLGWTKSITALVTVGNFASRISKLLQALQFHKDAKQNTVIHNIAGRNAHQRPKCNFSSNSEEC